MYKTYRFSRDLPVLYRFYALRNCDIESIGSNQLETKDDDSYSTSPLLLRLIEISFHLVGGANSDFGL